jgi:hypothetical protein
LNEAWPRQARVFLSHGPCRNEGALCN